MWSGAQTVLWVGTWAYVGVLSRQVLGSLAASAEGTLLARLGASFLLPNIFGCFTMGVFVPMTELFRAHPPLYTGVTTGFCGSCTTFATWQALVAVGLLEGAWVDALVRSGVTFASSLLAYSLGQHLGLSLARRISLWCEAHSTPSPAALQASLEASLPLQEVGAEPLRAAAGKSGGSQVSVAGPSSPPPLPPRRRGRERLSRAAQAKLTATALLVFGATSGAVWLGVLRDTAVYRLHWWVGMAFGPLGALLRYSLAQWNYRWPDFPAMTLVANVVGSGLNVVILVVENGWFLERRYPVPRTGREEECLGRLEPWLRLEVVRGSWALWAGAGASGGLCGSLSTVSTWLKEISALGARSRWLAYRYALVSVLGAQLVCLSLGGVFLAAQGSLSHAPQPDLRRCDQMRRDEAQGLHSAAQAINITMALMQRSV